MIDSETSFFCTTVSENIDISISYDGMLIVDGTEVINLFDTLCALNKRMLAEIDVLSRETRIL